MTTHRCDRPDSATTEPWRCPECGLLWEALPTSPVRQLRQKLKVGKLRLLGVVAQCVLALAVGWIIRSPRFMLLVCAVCVLILASWYWQERREMRRLAVNEDQANQAEGAFEA